MAGAKLEKTRWPGIYRRGDRWAFEWTDAAGKRRRGSARTLDEARAHKRQADERGAIGDTSVDGLRGRLTVAGYARDLFGADTDRPAGKKPVRGRYQGRRGAIRAATLADYRRHLELHVLPTIGDRPLVKLTTQELARLVAALAAREGDAYLADSSIRRIFAPLAAMLATATEEGLIRYNPAREVRLPSGRDALRRFNADDQADADDPAPGRARALTRDQLGTFLGIVDPRWRTFFELLATTGLRVSEALALRWGDATLDGGPPAVRVQRAFVRGVYGPPKSRYGRRTVPIPASVAAALRERRKTTEWPDREHLIFPTMTGTPVESRNLRRRTLSPAAEETGIGWAGFHAFRHHCASLLIAEGRNVVQVSRWLGHHSPAFTLDVYAHLMDEGVGAAIDLEGVGSGSCPESRTTSVGLEAL